MLALARAGMRELPTSPFAALALAAVYFVAPCLLLGLMAAAPGCARIERRNKSPLPPLRLARESVAVEKFSVRFPYADEDLNGGLWNDVDEQCFSPELRRRLAASGIRAGVVGGPLPAPLMRLFASQAPPSAPLESGTVDLLHEPAVLRGFLQIHSGQRSVVIVAGERERIAQLALVRQEADGQVTGGTFYSAMGVLALRFFPHGDGRTRLEVVPELQHGEAKKDWVVSEGRFQMKFEPPTEVFHDLRMETALAPGQMLLITCLPHREGSLGHHLFTEQAAAQPMQQKMLLLRPANSPLDDRFGDGESPKPE